MFRLTFLLMPAFLFTGCATITKSNVQAHDFIQLRDGRRMAVHHFGDPNGRPLLFFHGWPSDGSQAGLLDIAAKKNGFHVFAPDRPGIGCSEPLAARTVADWPADVRSLAAHYGLKKFAVLGVSGGGPYALATARALPTMITRAGVVCGAPPLDDPQDAHDLLPIYKLLLGAHRSQPRLLRWAFRIGRPFLAYAVPDCFLRATIHKLPPPDREALADPHAFNVVFRGMRRSWLSCRDGVHDDAILYAGPWGFAPENIRARLDFWHGEEDANFPHHLAERLAARVPGAHFHLVKDEGHYSLPVRRADEILATLAGP